MHKKIDSKLIDGFLTTIRSIENNDFAVQAAECCRFTHSTLGIVTEVAELKYLLDNPQIFDPEEYELKVHAEIGDICFYLLQGVDNFNWTYEQVMETEAKIKMNLHSDMDPMDNLVYLAGEITDVLKKHFSYHVKVDLDRVLSWYQDMWNNLHLLTSELNTTVDKCIKVVTAKLEKRYPAGKFRYKDRINRNRDVEQKAMKEAESNDDQMKF